MIKVVSFDLDGTLADLNFEDAVWRKEIPRLYAERHGVSLEEARSFVYEAYASISDQELDWYDITYWLKRFDIRKRHQEILKNVSHLICLYPDTLPALRRLQESYRLVVVSNAMREFIDFKIQVDGLQRFFSKVYSLPSDLKTLKGETAFAHVAKELGVSKKELVHVGDQEQFDYAIPKKAGIQAYLLDRSGKKKGKHVVHSLQEFADKLLGD